MKLTVKSPCKSDLCPASLPPRQMKEITAYIKATRVGAVLRALYPDEAVAGLSLIDVRGFGRSRSLGASVSVVQDFAGAVPYVKLELVCANEWESEIVALVEKAAFTGNAGDGMIFVTDIRRAVRISTGEQGEDAVLKELGHP